MSDETVNWSELIESLSHGPDQGDALAAEFADRDSWSSEQLAEFVGEVIPDYASELKGESQKDDADKLALADQAKALTRMNDAATAELEAREAAEAEAQAAIDELTGDSDEDGESDENEDLSDDSDDDSEDDESDDDEDLTNQDTENDEDGESDDLSQGSKNKPSFGERKRRKPSTKRMNGSDDTPNTPSFNSSTNTGRGEPLDMWDSEYYSNAKSTAFMVGDNVGAQHKPKGRNEWESTREYANAVAAQFNATNQKSMPEWNGEATSRVQTKDHMGYMHTEFGTPLTKGMTHEQQLDIIDGVRAAANKAPALVADASGGCAVPPLTPRRDIMRRAARFAPVRASLPSINVAAEGGLMWMIPPSYTQASAGIQVTTHDQNKGGYGDPAPAGGAPFKACMRMPCPTWYEAYVDMISVCIIFDNLQQRVWGGLIENFMMDVDVMMDQVIEQYFLAGIDAASDPVANLHDYYGATRSFLRDGINMRRNMIEVEHLASSQIMNWYVPEQALDILAMDLVNNDTFGMNFLFNYSVADLAMALRSKYMLNLIPYRDSGMNVLGEARNQTQTQIVANSAGGDFKIEQLNRTPITYMHQPDTFAQLDGGGFGTGLYRDSILNKTNDVALFEELFLEIVKLGPQAVTGAHDLVESGTGAAARTPFDRTTALAHLSAADLPSGNHGQLVLNVPGNPATQTPYV